MVKKELNIESSTPFGTNAIANYTKSIEINPNNSDAYLMRGILYGTLNKEKEGCEDLNKAARMGNQKAIEQKNKLCK